MSDAPALLATLTPLLGLSKPTVGADLDVWGGELNGNFDILDNVMTGSASDARYLQLAGGTMTGPINVSGSNPLMLTANTLAPTTPALSNISLRLLGGTGSQNRFVMDGFGGNIAIMTRQANGNPQAPTSATAGQSLLQIQAQGWGTTNYGAAAQITMVTAETHSDTAHGGYIDFRTVAAGTTAVTERMRLTDAGMLLINQTAAVGTNKLQVTGGLSFDAGTLGDGTSTAYLNLNGAQNQLRGFGVRTAGIARWALTVINPEPGAGAGTGSDIILGGYSDTGAYMGPAFYANRSSGPLGLGAPGIQQLAPWSMVTPRAVSPNGVIGNSISFNTDAQPTATLTNAITTTNGSTSVSILWPNACGGAGPISVTPAETWVNIQNAQPVGGITLNGWYQVRSITNANTFTVTAATPATSAAIGGGAMTVTPSFPTVGDRIYTSVASGAHGFILQKVQLFSCDPAFYQTLASGKGPGYQARWTVVQTPPDGSRANYWGVTGEEMDLVNRAADEGYNPDIYAAPRPTIGLWMGANPTPMTGAQMPCYNWNAILGVFGYHGIPGVYSGLNITGNALVGAQHDRNGHGGVGAEIFGAWHGLAQPPFSTVAGSPTITVRMVTGQALSIAQANGNQVWLFGGYALNGATFGNALYTMANVNTAAGTFTIQAAMSATTTGGGGPNTAKIAFENNVPYGPAQFWGRFLHGITSNPQSSFESGGIIETQPGVGFLWNDGTGTASVNTTTTGPGNISIVLKPAGNGAINLAGPIVTPTLATSSAGLAPGTWWNNGGYICVA